jgi:hypothetical protein
MKDFSRSNQLIVFTADGDTFRCAPGAAAILIGDVVSDINTAKDVKDQLRFIIEFFDLILVDESAELLKQRLRSKENPIDVGQALAIVEYITEEMSVRPTQPSSRSSAGSATGETGTSSTAGAPNETSIPPISDSIGSATLFTGIS